MARKPADQSVSREDIIQAAAEVLKQKGFEASTMKDIAAEVNLTAASLYHHFRNKNALMIAVLEGGMDFAIEQMRPVVESDLSASEKLRKMIAVHVISLTEHTAVGAAMVFEIGALIGIRTPSAADGGKNAEDFLDRRDLFFKRRDEFEGFFREVVSEGIASGEFRQVDVPIFVKTMMGAHNWVSVWYRPGGRLTGQDVADHMADTFLRALAP
ncbi:MAG: TetR/AcrR family transcriptional regulator [Chloroflexota bacterium]